MRTVTTTLRDAMITGQSYRAFAKATIKKSRIFFNAATRDFSPGAPSASIQTAPVPQDVCYSPIVGELLTAYVDELKVRIVKDGDSTVITPYETTNYCNTFASNKPALIDEYLFYVDSDGYFKRAYLDMAEIALEHDDCVLGWSNISAHSYGSAFAFSATQAALLKIDEGGLRPYVYTLDGTWSESKAPGRFTYPAEPVASTDRYKPVYSAAVKLGDAIFIYARNHETGGIDGIKYDVSTGTWTEVFEAVPADLSDFYPTNAILTPTGEILLAGQFQRDEEELGSGQTVRNLALRSQDGFTFSMDRFTLFSNLGYRFHVAVYGDNFYGSDNNLVVEDEAPAWMINDPTVLEIPQDDIIAVTWSDSNANSQATITIASGNYGYDNEVLLAKGNELVLYLGYSSNNTIEWVKFGTYIIQAKQTSTRDGSHGLVLTLSAMGLWKVGAITYPLYTELDSRHAVFDDVDELDNMYVAPDDAETEGMLSIDFWGAGPMTLDGVTGLDPNGSGSKVAFDPQTISGSHTLGVMTTEFMVANGWGSNPVVSDEVSVELSIYGWSRATQTGEVNDTIEAVLIVEDANGDERYVRGSDYASLESTYDTFPLTYYDVAAGSDPIVFKFEDGIEEGETVKRIGIIMSATNSAQTYLERVDITGLSREAPVGNLVWEDVADGLRVPDVARPHIMFSQVPTFDMNFVVSAKFRATGDNTYFGIVGLANDAANYICGRINTPDGLAEIIKVRDGEVTVLASAAFTAPSEIELYFKHEDGYLFFSYWDNGELYDAGLVDYEWTEADGRMSMSDDNVRHVGVYGFMDVPFFEICGYNFGQSAGIGFAPGQPQSRFDRFPAGGGRLIIDDNEYEYTRKTSFITPRGPFQVRNFLKWNQIYCVPSMQNDKWAVEFTWFYYTGKGTKDYAGYLIATDSGNSWVNSEVCWKPRRRTKGVYHWVDGDRSRWYSNTLKKYSMGNQTKIFVLPHLYGVTLLNGETTTHPTGTICKMKTNDSIMLTQFISSGGQRDISLETILTSLCGYAGAQASFPGNYELAAYTLSPGSPYELS